VNRFSLLCLALMLSLVGCADDDSPTPATTSGDTAVTGDTTNDVASGADTAGGSDTAAGPDSVTPQPDATTGNPVVEAYSACFPHIVEQVQVNLDLGDLAFDVSDTCAGSSNQVIDDVEKLVILGDSISAGAGSGSDSNAYFNVLKGQLEAFYGHSIELANCAVGGSVNSDLAGQISGCFTATETAKTLVVFTSGGNDIANMAFNKLSVDAGIQAVDTMIGHLETAVQQFDDTTRFPNGVSVVFANVYEYTDATANMSSCPLAGFAGLSGVWDAGLPVFAYLTEEYARIAAKYGRDVMFMQESFCGHGYARDDSNSPCYGVSGDLWFAVDCIHPNAQGHAAIADLFYATITGEDAP